MVNYKRKIVSKLRYNLLKQGNNIVKIINEISVFNEKYKLIFRLESSEDNTYCYCSFALVYKHLLYIKYIDIINFYSKAVYSIENEGIYSGYITGHGRGVFSIGEPGMRIGNFVFYLQILLCINVGVRDFKLDNYTDNPERSAKGIYNLLKPDRRTHELKFKKKYNISLSDMLHITEGSMRFTLNRDSKKKWKKYVIYLIIKIKKSIYYKKIWNDPENILKIIKI